MTEQKTLRVVLPIQGMHCAACVTRLEKVLGKVSGVTQANVNLATEKAQIESDSPLPVADLIAVVDKAGFSVPQRVVTLQIKGMHCAACVTRLEKVLRRESGVISAVVNLATEKARIQAVVDVTDAQLLQAISRAGYEGLLPDNNKATIAEQDKNQRDTDRDWLIAGALCTMPLLLPMLAGLWGVQFQLPVFWQWLLATLVQFGLGWRFYRGAWASVRVGSSNMDVLVALGTTAAYGLSLYQWLFQAHHAHLYFESSATVITLVWFGKWLEQRAKRQPGAGAFVLFVKGFFRARQRVFANKGAITNGGNGVGQPLGFLNSPALVTVAAESGQTADTIVAANVVKMYAAMPSRNRMNAIWLIHPDAEPQLSLMTLGQMPVYLPPGGLSNNPYGTLFGRPVIPHQVCETVGDVFDIGFVDLSQYLALIKAGGLKSQTSIHLWFDQDLTAFKFTLRIGGQPWWASSVASRDGSFALSPFVTLAAR